MRTPALAALAIVSLAACGDDACGNLPFECLRVGITRVLPDPGPGYPSLLAEICLNDECVEGSMGEELLADEWSARVVLEASSDAVWSVDMQVTARATSSAVDGDVYRFRILNMRTDTMLLDETLVATYDRNTGAACGWGCPSAVF